MDHVWPWWVALGRNWPVWFLNASKLRHWTTTAFFPYRPHHVS